jgi:hypothetical protein
VEGEFLELRVDGVLRRSHGTGVLEIGMLAA